MTILPEAKEKIKEMFQLCYAFLLKQCPEVLTKGEPSQTFDLELEAPADMVYKECKLRTMDTVKVKLNLTFFAPEQKSRLILPPGMGLAPRPTVPTLPVPEPDPED